MVVLRRLALRTEQSWPTRWRSLIRKVSDLLVTFDGSDFISASFIFLCVQHGFQEASALRLWGIPNTWTLRTILLSLSSAQYIIESFLKLLFINIVGCRELLGSGTSLL